MEELGPLGPVYAPWAPGYLPWRIVVFGCRLTVASETKRPLIADRLPLAFDPSEILTVVLGCRAAVLFFTNRPLIAE